MSLVTRITSRLDWRIWIFVVALIVRIAYVVAQSNLHLFDLNLVGGDTTWYRAVASSLLAGHGYTFEGSVTAIKTPGYPLFLAAVFELSRATEFIGIVQCFFGAGTVVLLADLANCLWGKRPALLTAIVGSIYPGLVFWTSFVISDSLYIFLVVLALWFTNHALTKPVRMRHWIAAGLTFGAASLTRPIVLEFALIIGVIALFVRKFRRGAVVGLLALFLIYAPWVVRNELSLHGFVPTNTEAGEVLYSGNSPGVKGGSGGYWDDRDFTPLVFSPHTSEVVMNNTYETKALDWMASNPIRVLSLVPAKLGNMFRPTYAGASTFDLLVTYLSYPLVVILAAIGLIKSVCRERRAMLYVLIGFLLYHVVFHGLVTGTIRYRAPIEAWLVLLAGLGADAIISAFPHKNVRSRSELTVRPRTKSVNDELVPIGAANVD